MPKQPNKLVTIHFEINDRGQVEVIHPGPLPIDYIKSLIEFAAMDIQAGKFETALYPGPPNPSNEIDKIIADANEILNGDGFQNLDTEHE